MKSLKPYKPNLTPHWLFIALGKEEKKKSKDNASNTIWILIHTAVKLRSTVNNVLLYFHDWYLKFKHSMFICTFIEIP